jgi:hypothetical protein
MKSIKRSITIALLTIFLVIPQIFLVAPQEKKATPVPQDSEMITASISTIWWREDGLKQVVAAMLPQVDRLNIFLQGYKSIPEFLNNSKITVVRGEDYPEALALGASAKFHWAGQVKGYHFTIDDDIVYPPDYVKYCIQKIEQYNRKAVVGFHGTLLKDDLMQCSANKKKFKFRQTLFNHRFPLDQDQVVHLLGTGVMAYHTDTIKVNIKDFPTRSMDDIYFGILAQQQQVPLICLQRVADYLKPIEPLASNPSSVYEQARQNGGKDMLAVLQQFGVWKLYECK